MKKKFLGVISLSLLFALSGCDLGLFGNNGLDFNQKDEDDSHVCEPDLKAGYVTDDNEHWYTCKDPNCSKKLSAEKHLIEETVISGQGSNCETTGVVVKRTCEVCGYEKTTNIKKAHKYEEVAWQSMASCTEAGVGIKVCKNCGFKKEISAVPRGHNYPTDKNGNTIFEFENGEPSCNKAAIGKVTCDVCGESHYEKVGPYGHALSSVGNAIKFKNNFQEIYINKCMVHNCNYGVLSFGANMVTNRSKATLVLNDNGSYSFTGRPIGNDVSFDSVTQDNHTPIYNKDNLGDFFEFEFTLTEEQAELLSSARLYCDAKPADYMYFSGIDFWANDDYMDDWTPGLYIDDIPEHAPTLIEGDNPATKEVEKSYYEGVRMRDYRYALYVDDELKEFDSNIKNPVQYGDVRGEFVVPYLFSLHAGVNNIRLHMAGGFIAKFFHFEFRTADVEEENTFYPIGLTQADLNYVESKWNKVAYELYAEDCDGQNAPSSGLTADQKNTRLGKNNIMTDTWDITNIMEGLYDIYVKAAYSSGNGSSYWSADQNMTIGNDNANNNGGGDGMNGPRYIFKVDDLDPVPAASPYTYSQSGLSELGNGGWTKIPVASMEIPAFAREFTMTYQNNGYSLWIYAIRLVKVGAYSGKAINLLLNE